MRRPKPDGAGSPVALVTGGGVRLGRAMALALARQGFDVAISYMTSSDRVVSLAHAVRETGRRFSAVQADLATASGGVQVAAHVRGAFGRLDLLVNSASTFAASDLLDVTTDDWDDVMAVNLRAPFVLVRDTFPLLSSARGSIINMVDLSALRPWTRHPHHAVSKAGLLHLTRVMARAFAPRVRVNAIAPGVVLAPEHYTDRELDALRRRIPMGRLGKARHVTDAVRFLLDADYVTGQVIVVDGGMSL